MRSRQDNRDPSREIFREKSGPEVFDLRVAKAHLGEASTTRPEYTPLSVWVSTLGGHFNVALVRGVSF